MAVRWHKRYLPRGLYGQAALIVLGPALAFLLVFSVVLAQRHFEAVSEQLSDAMALELAHVRDLVAQSPDRVEALARAAPLASALEIELAFVEPPEGGYGPHRRHLHDISGLTIIGRLPEALPGVRFIDLAGDTQRVTVVLSTDHGDLAAQFARRRIAPKNPQKLLNPIMLAGMLLVAITYLFMRRQLRPIRRLAKAADAFGRGQSLPYRPQGAAEVRAAGSAFLAMRNRIERHIEQRTLMLSGVSHDLRTPLTRMRLQLSMLDPAPEIEAMQRDLDEMEAMLDAFLDFARTDMTEALARTDVVALAEGVVADAVRAGQAVEFRGEQTVGVSPVAPVRALALRRALANLVANARRYASRCRVSVALAPSSLRFIVEDDGPGIPPERREEAMRPFTRLEASRNQDRGGGVGLGLAIAMDVARSHGGTLRLGESDDLGGLRAEIVLAR